MQSPPHGAKLQTKPLLTEPALLSCQNDLSVTLDKKAPRCPPESQAEELGSVQQLRLSTVHSEARSVLIISTIKKAHANIHFRGRHKQGSK